MTKRHMAFRVTLAEVLVGSFATRSQAVDFAWSLVPHRDVRMNGRDVHVETLEVTATIGSQTVTRQRLHAPSLPEHVTITRTV